MWEGGDGRGGDRRQRRWGEREMVREGGVDDREMGERRGVQKIGGVRDTERDRDV